MIFFFVFRYCHSPNILFHTNNNDSQVKKVFLLDKSTITTTITEFVALMEKTLLSSSSMIHKKLNLIYECWSIYDAFPYYAEYKDVCKCFFILKYCTRCVSFSFLLESLSFNSSPRRLSVTRTFLKKLMLKCYITTKILSLFIPVRYSNRLLLKVYIFIFLLLLQAGSRSR